jgi:uridine kinase
VLLIFLGRISTQELIVLISLELLLVILIRFVVERRSSIYLWYLSPLPLFIYVENSYFPVISAIFAICAIHLATNARRFILAGLSFGLASVFLAPIAYTLPFLIIYALANPRQRKPMSRFILAQSFILIVWQLASLWFTIEANLLPGIAARWGMTSVQVDFREFTFYPLVALYVAFLIWLYRAGRFTPKSLFVFIASFTIVSSLLVIQTSELAIWGIVILLYLLDFSNIRLFVVLLVFQVLVIATESVAFTMFIQELSNSKIIKVQNLLELTSTILLCYTGFFAVRLTKLAFLAGDPYKLAEKPIVISVAGDSGVGKDKLANSICLAFGQKYTSILCGDNYHLFERNGIEWRSRSHLNPAMNDLLTWKGDLRKAVKRDTFVSPFYDHSTGIIGQQSNKKKSDLIVSQGLHALYEELVTNSDITIFLELEDELRIKFKIERDINHRGRTKNEIERQIEERSEDYIKYIEVQKQNADFIFRVESDQSGAANVLRVSTNRHYAVLRQVEQNLLTYVPEVILGRNVDQKYEINLRTDRISATTLDLFLRATVDSYADLFPTGAAIDENISGLLQVLTFSLLGQMRLDVK